MSAVRSVAAVSALLVATLVPASGVAQTSWPERKVHFINPAAPGSGGIDALSRQMVEKLKEMWGQPVVMENVPGTGGSVGIARLARSEPDGYTIGLSGDAALAVNISLYKSLSYDPVKDIAPIVMIGRTSNLLVVNAEKGPKTLQDLVAQAKAQPGSVTFNSNGYGTSQHIGFELLKKSANIEILHTTSRTPTLPDILGGHITASFANIMVALPNVQAGKLRALGISSPERSAVAPEVPTIAEQGYAGFNATAWFGLVAPAGTPDAIIRKINADTAKALADPSFRKKLTDLGFHIDGGGPPEEFGSFIRSEIPRVAALLKSTGIKLD